MRAAVVEERGGAGVDRVAVDLRQCEAPLDQDPRCGEMRVIGFITEPTTIRRILDHLKAKAQAHPGPPASATASTLAPV